MVSRIRERPVKFTDPDGKLSSLPDWHKPIDMNKVNAALSSATYNDGTSRIPSVSRDTSSWSFQKVKLCENPFLAIAIGLPRGTPGPDEYSDEYSLIQNPIPQSGSTKSTRAETAIGLIGMYSTIIQNSTDPATRRKVGDVYLNFTLLDSRNGNHITEWSIQTTGITPEGNVTTKTLTYDDAKKFLADNENFLKEYGVYEELLSIIGN